MDGQLILVTGVIQRKRPAKTYWSKPTKSEGIILGLYYTARDRYYDKGYHFYVACRCGCGVELRRGKQRIILAVHPGPNATRRACRWHWIFRPNLRTSKQLPRRRTSRYAKAA